MLMPKRVKYRRQHRGCMAGLSNAGNDIQYGDFGLQALEASWITSQQIEAARIAMTRYIKRGGKVWIRIFPDKPVTEKPAETRMGKGKGSPEYWVAVVKPGRIMFELGGIKEDSPGGDAPGLPQIADQNQIVIRRIRWCFQVKGKEIRELTDQELEQRLGDLKEELFNLRFQLATGQLENMMQIKDCRQHRPG